MDFSDSEFALARLNAKNLSAVLVSESIKCMSDRASLSFRYWHTGAAMLSICVVKSISFGIIDCQSIGSASTEHVYVDIPRFDEPIRIAFKADSILGEGVVALDDIQVEVCETTHVVVVKKNFFQGKLCPTLALSGNSGLGSTKIRRPEKSYSLLTPDANVCRLLSCNFDREHLCIYESKRVANSLSMFSVRNGVATTMLFERSKVAMLESPPFHLNAPARLHFDYSIQVC